MGNWEDTAITGSLFVAIFAVMALHNIKTPEIAPPALAAPAQVAEAAPTPAISFVVTGKRMPKECKGLAATDEIEARCEALRDQTKVDIQVK